MKKIINYLNYLNETDSIAVDIFCWTLGIFLMVAGSYLMLVLFGMLFGMFAPKAADHVEKQHMEIVDLHRETNFQKTPVESAAGDVANNTETENPVSEAVIDRMPLSHDQIKANPYSGYQGLSPEGQEAYDRIYTGMCNRDEQAFLGDLGFSADCGETVMNALKQDCPELFDIHYSNIYSDADTGVLLSFGFNYREDNEQTQELVSSWAETVVDSIPDSYRQSESEIALWLHDYLMRTIDYVDGAPDNQTVVSAIAGETVCAGYAQAYSLLLHQAGIMAGYVSGTARGEGHAWDIVLLDGELGYVDVTWDDTGDTSTYAETHEYFGVGAHEMYALGGHILDSYRVDFGTAPGCSQARALVESGSF